MTRSTHHNLLSPKSAKHVQRVLSAKIISSTRIFPKSAISKVTFQASCHNIHCWISHQQFIYNPSLLPKLITIAPKFSNNDAFRISPFPCLRAARNRFDHQSLIKTPDFTSISRLARIFFSISPKKSDTEQWSSNSTPPHETLRQALISKQTENYLNTDRRDHLYWAWFLPQNPIGPMFDGFAFCETAKALERAYEAQREENRKNTPNMLII